MRYKVLVSIIILFSFAAIYGQLSENYNNLGFYEKLRIEDSNGASIIIDQANIGNGVINGANKQVAFYEIRKLEYKSGDKALVMCVVFSVLGGIAGSVVAVSNAETEDHGYYEETTVDILPMYLLSFAGAGLGWIIGAATPIYSTIYDKRAGIGMLENNLQLDFTLGKEIENQRNMYLGLRYNF